MSFIAEAEQQTSLSVIRRRGGGPLLIRAWWRCLGAIMFCLLGTSCAPDATLHNAPGKFNTLTPRPFDLAWFVEDINLVPFRPAWSCDESGREPPNPKTACDWVHAESTCTSQNIEVDNGFRVFEIGTCPGTANLAGGHMNWSLATIDGYLYPAAPGTIDADLDLDLYLDEGRGSGTAYTNANAPIGYPVGSSHRVSGIEAECLMPETLESFGAYWWRQLRNVYPPVTADQTCATKDLFRTNGGIPAYGVVTGLLGLDVVHALHTELHPIYAMAARVDTSSQAQVTTDEWVFFIRNWGTEGACSGKNHLWNSRNGHKYYLTIPWRDGAVDVTIVRPHDPHEYSSDLDEAYSSEIFSTCGTPVPIRIAYRPGLGVLIEVTLPDPSEACSADGQLYLRWTGPAISPANQLIYAVNRPPDLTAEYTSVRRALGAEPNQSYMGVDRKGRASEVIVPGMTRVDSLWEWARSER